VYLAAQVGAWWRHQRVGSVGDQASWTGPGLVACGSQVSVSASGLQAFTTQDKDWADVPPVSVLSHAYTCIGAIGIHATLAATILHQTPQQLTVPPGCTLHRTYQAAKSVTRWARHGVGCVAEHASSTCPGLIAAHGSVAVRAGWLRAGKRQETCDSLVA
jgi:hypothetical protein